MNGYTSNVNIVSTLYWYIQYVVIIMRSFPRQYIFVIHYESVNM